MNRSLEIATADISVVGIPAIRMGMSTSVSPIRAGLDRSYDLQRLALAIQIVIDEPDWKRAEISTDRA